MPYVILPSRWSRQPDGGPVKIDWNHPLAQDLRFFCFPVAPGVMLEVVSQTPGTKGGSAYIGGSGIPEGDGGGMVAKLASGTSDFYSWADNDKHDILGAMTLAWRGALDSTSPGHHFAGKHAGNGATDNPFDWRTFDSTTTNPTLVRARTSGSPTLGAWNSGSSISTGATTRHTTEVTQGATLDTTPAFYIDGTLTSTTTIVAGPASEAVGSSTGLRVGRRADAGFQMNGTTEYVAGWARQWPAEALKEFRRYPYSLIRKQEYVFYSIAAGSFKSAWARNANTVLGARAQ